MFATLFYTFGSLFSVVFASTEPSRFLKLDRGRPLISPSVAKADFCNLLKDCTEAVEGGAELLHFSVQDGRFVPKISFGAGVISALRPHFPDTVFDVKLGVIEPEHRIKDFVKAGADIISFHPEATLQPAAVVHLISDAGCVPGLVINPSTPLQSIVHMLDQVQVIVVMIVSPGWGGSKYIPAALEKIQDLVKLCEQKGLTPLIEVDGGVSPSNVQLFLDAGANTIVAGGSVFSAADKKQAVDCLRGGAV